MWSCVTEDFLLEFRPRRIAIMFEVHLRIAFVAASACYLIPPSSVGTSGHLHLVVIILR